MTMEYKGIIEGLIFASGDEGITKKQISKILDLPEKTIEHLIEELKFDYEHVNRGITLMQQNEVYHLTTKPEHNEYYKKWLQQPRTTRMSQASLETLAIIAYKQPITRVEIEEIRGVNSDYAVQNLLARSLIEIVGRKDSIGRPILYGTTKEFLIYFGLSSLDDLPSLPEDIDPESVAKEAELLFTKFQEENNSN